MSIQVHVGDSHLPIFIQLQGSPLSIMGVKLHSMEEILPDNRRQMNFRTDKELIEYIRQNYHGLRAKLPSLTRGTIESLYLRAGWNDCI